MRIAPLEPPYEPEIDDQLRSMMPAGVEPIALFRTLAKNPPMVRASQAWARHELGRSLAVGVREREIVIDRTCARCGCEYEWGVHVAFFAGRASISPEQVTSIAHGDHRDPCWETESDRLLIRLVDALHDEHDVGDALWVELAVELTEAQILDLLLLCGWYHAISFVARAARVPLEPWAPTFASVAPAGTDRSG